MDNSSYPTMAPTIQEDILGLTYKYVCKDNSPEALACPINCTSLEACDDCQCQVSYLEDTGGPWGDVMDVLFCLLPIIYLIYATVKRNPTPTTVSLNVSAAIMFLVRLMYLGSNPLLVSGCLILGIHEVLTPLSIMAGAITLFETMETTKCLPYMMREMKVLTGGHPVAEVMLLFGFATLVEGASGFGTPVALGAPMLVSTGNPALESVVIMLLFNTFATVWGAVGTPIWFGFSQLDLSEEDKLDISKKAAVAMVFSAFILIPFIMTILVPFQVVMKNIVFLLLSIGTVMLPLLGLAFVNYEFPSLIGGLLGMFLTGILINFKVGLAEHVPEDLAPPEADAPPENAAEGTDAENPKDHRAISDLSEAQTPSKPVKNNQGESSTLVGSEDYNVEVREDGSPAAVLEGQEAGDMEEQPPLVEEAIKNSLTKSVFSATPQATTTTIQEDAVLGPRKTLKEGYVLETCMRTFPIWGVVICLILTRVGSIGIKQYLTMQTPYWGVVFGTYGDFRISASLVFQLKDILTYPGLNWKYELFYVPFLLPFVFVSGLTMILYRKDMASSPRDVAATVVSRLSDPAIALVGALILVQLMIRFGVEAPSYLLGTILGEWFKEGFVVICPLLGALGSFFSGSTTVSNLTFGEIQRIAARELGVNVNTMLALQAFGGSAGNGICLNNIISALAVVGLNVSEGEILMRTGKFVFLSTTIATGVMLAFFFRFN